MFDKSPVSEQFFEWLHAAQPASLERLERLAS
jgi:hypothetical protein